MIRRSLRSLRRREDGQVALETLVVLPVWLFVIVMYVELLLVLGSAMLVRSNLDRASIQASSLGCVTPAVVTSLTNVHGFGISPLHIDKAVYKPGGPLPGDPSSSYYQLPQTGTALNTTGWGSAFGSSPSCVPQGDYIYLQVSYQDNNWFTGLFGISPTVHQDTLSISHTLQ